MKAHTFFILVLAGFFALMVGMQINNVPMSLFAFTLMTLPAAAVIVQSEVK